MIIKDPIRSYPRRQITQLPLSLVDDLKTRWPATELQQGDFVNTINRINAIERVAKQNTTNREINWISKII